MNRRFKKRRKRVKMRKLKLILRQTIALGLLAMYTSGCVAQKTTVAKNAPVFSQFSYTGNDKIYNDNPLKPGEFYTPILQGCYPDPSITRKGNDFYLVSSTFAMFPGVPIFHSNDLVNWKQIGHVLDRRTQLKVDSSGISAGIYAPDIKYNANNETFYMITTQFSGGMNNMVVKTKDPLKGWSDPYKLKFNGIDPSLFFDDNGKAYVVHNDAPDRGKERYNGHRIIKIWEYDITNDQVIAGTDKMIVDGGVDTSLKPIWIEAPHIYKRNGKYYLMCAEGGTGGWHSEVVFMSDSPKGPFVPAPGNPILTQRHFPKERANKMDWAGHADLVEGLDGKFYGVFLGIRPNEKDRVNAGRETFILPVDWTGTWPVFENGLVPLKPKLKMPVNVTNQTGKNGFFPNGNFTFTDDLTSSKLDYRWIGVRVPREEFSTSSKAGLIINPFATNIKSQFATSTLFHRQQHNVFDAAVTLKYTPNSDKELAGIVCYQSEAFNYVFGITKKENEHYLVLAKTARERQTGGEGPRRPAPPTTTLIASTKIDMSKPVRLQVSSSSQDEYSFNYSTDGTTSKNLGGPVSGNILSTNVAGGFTGALIGLYATAGNDIQP